MIITVTIIIIMIITVNYMCVTEHLNFTKKRS